MRSLLMLGLLAAVEGTFDKAPESLQCKAMGGKCFFKWIPCRTPMIYLGVGGCGFYCHCCIDSDPPRLSRRRLQQQQPDHQCTDAGGECVPAWRSCVKPDIFMGSRGCEVSRYCCKINGTRTWDDSRCTSRGGQCKLNTTYCAGFFLRGECGGPSQRQCCQSNVNEGNLTRTDASGASRKTAEGQERLNYHGVAASEHMARQDWESMNKYKSHIMFAGKELKVDPAIIAGIISRESRAGNFLTKGGREIGGGSGFGLMQHDPDATEEPSQGRPFSLQHIMHGTRHLLEMIHYVSVKFPSWTDDMKLKGGISAYNAGPGNVRSYENMDLKTTGDDYANDVVARAKWYKRNGYTE